MTTTQEGPAIESLTRRLAEVPSDFLLPPGSGGETSVAVAAVVSDLLRDLGGETLSAARSAPFSAAADGGARRLSLILLAAWLLHDRWFREAGRFARPVYDFLSRGLDDLAGIVDPSRFASDPDRREELARVCLKALGLRPAGETGNQSADRLATLNSLERLRVLRDSRKAQERIRQVQEAMRKKAAEEAAPAYGRE